MSTPNSNYVIAGDVLQLDASTLVGHGLLQQTPSTESTVTGNIKVQATVSGVVERVNKLITVRPLLSRYQGEIGDVVIGRVVEVSDKRWKVDVHSRQSASLSLSAVHMGGIQRRRTADDELQMRQFYVEGDLISAEVQKLRQSDGAVALHTRNLNYGKLQNGLLVQVPASLIKRCKQHFQSLSAVCGSVDIVLGVNGMIWIYDPTVQPVRKEEETDIATQHEQIKDLMDSDHAAEDEEILRNLTTSADSRQRIARVRNSILALSRAQSLIWSLPIMNVYAASIELDMTAHDLLNPDNLPRLMAHVKQYYTQNKAATMNTGG